MERNHWVSSGVIHVGTPPYRMPLAKSRWILAIFEGHRPTTALRPGFPTAKYRVGLL